MPTYDYRCQACGECWEQHLLIADRDAPCGMSCPLCKHVGQVERMITAAGISYRINDRKKIPNSFKDVLRKIKATHRGSKIEV